jgi:ribonucleoside-diphosphate reductase alpha chain
MPSKIKKRDGRVVDFEPRKIAIAIEKAFKAVGEEDGAAAKKLADAVVELLDARIKGVPSVEDVQDLVEEVLIKHGFAKVAKAYILYRRERAELREAKRFFGVVDDLKLGVNAIKVLEKRYLLRDENLNIIETPAGMFRRVAKAIAGVDRSYNPGCDVKKVEEEFYCVMANLEFLPNSPTLMNAGTEIGQLSACFVLPVEDSVEGIFDALKYMALIHQSGGGTGFSFSRIRPKGDIVKSTKGVASGPLSFMRAFDMATEIIKQGGKRRGANMGILRVDHPDILEFIPAKGEEGLLTNFNVSVAVTDAFMQAVEKDEWYPLINPRNNEVVKKLRARDVFDLIVTAAWRTGDPGLIFIDEINRHNPTPHLGEIESTNPCAEQPLLPYESCNLGSVNLARMLKREGGEAVVDYEKLGRTVKTAVHFLDNVIDANRFPLRQIEEMTKGNRKIGLGVMGFAQALLELGIPYDSPEALKKAEEIMGFISKTAREASRELAEERGVFPNYEGSVWEERGIRVRNAAITTIAPTGTLSIIAGTSSGIEPIFAVSFYRSVMEGTRLLEVNPVFERIARERGFYSKELLREIARVGSIQGMKEIPRDVRRLFVTALDIAPEWHVKMQAAFQRYVDSAVSKTVNLPSDATLEDVKKVYMLAYKLGCKGITIYRYGSKPKQVLYIGPVSEASGAEAEPEPECLGRHSSEECPL